MISTASAINSVLHNIRQQAKILSQYEGFEIFAHGVLSEVDRAYLRYNAARVDDKPETD